MQELKPCPFCGGEPETIDRPHNFDSSLYFSSVFCYCGGYSSTAYQHAIGESHHEASKEAKDKWNRRT